MQQYLLDNDITAFSFDKCRFEFQPLWCRMSAQFPSLFIPGGVKRALARRVEPFHNIFEVYFEFSPY